MDAKVIIYFYIESSAVGSFSDSKKPIVLSDGFKTERQMSYDIFKECGGLRVVDYYKNDKTHVRMSLWQSADGYQKWLQHENNLHYLKVRATYHSENKITELLEGPFEAVMHD